MEWMERMNLAADELERSLTGEVDYARLARTACCSVYHFQRMFAYLADLPLSEYVRRRRMSRAAVDLRAGMKVIDVAQRYGYALPTAFTRAFQAVHGVPPSRVRDGGVPVRAFPPIVLQGMVQGRDPLEYRLESRGAFRVVGISAPLDRQMEANFRTVPDFWAAAVREGMLPRLSALRNAPPEGLLGVCFCPDEGEWRYAIAVASTLPAGELEAYDVPAAAWAVFSGAGDNRSLQALQRRVFTQWLPTSGYAYGSAPDLEVYLRADPQDARYELWIPVVRAGE